MCCSCICNKFSANVPNQSRGNIPKPREQSYYDPPLANNDYVGSLRPINKRSSYSPQAVVRGRRSALREAQGSKIETSEEKVKQSSRMVNLPPSGEHQDSAIEDVYFELKPSEEKGKQFSGRGYQGSDLKLSEGMTKLSSTPSTREEGLSGEDQEYIPSAGKGALSFSRGERSARDDILSEGKVELFFSREERSAVKYTPSQVYDPFSHLRRHWPTKPSDTTTKSTSTTTSTTTTSTTRRTTTWMPTISAQRSSMTIRPVQNKNRNGILTYTSFVRLIPQQPNSTQTHRLLIL